MASKRKEKKRKGEGKRTNHDGEDTLLHLSGVLGTKNDHLLPLEVNFNTSRTRHSRREPISRELTRVLFPKKSILVELNPRRRGRLT